MHAALPELKRHQLNATITLPVTIVGRKYGNPILYDVRLPNGQVVRNIPSTDFTNGQFYAPE